MKLAIDHAVLRSALQLCATATEKRTVVTATSHVRLETDGDVLTVAATDLEVTVVVRLGAVVAESGGCTVEAAALIDIVKGATDAVAMTLDSKNMRLHVAAGAANYKLPSMPLDYFPELPEFSDSEALGLIELSFGELMPMLRSVTYAMPSEDRDGFNLKGVNVKIQRKSVELCAMDGYRFALYSLPIQYRADDAFMLPSKLVRASGKLVMSADSARVGLAWNENHVRMTAGSVSLFGRRDDVRFPNYSLPDISSERLIVVDPSALASALRRVSAFTVATTRGVILQIGGGKLMLISAGGERGACSDSVPCVHSEPMKLAINAHHLADALEEIHTPQAELSIGDYEARLPVIARPVESDLPFTATHLITQMDITKLAVN